MAHPLDRIEPGIKVTAQMSPEPTREDLDFVRALGVTHAVLWTDASKSSYEYYASRRELFAEAGITVYGFGNLDVHNVDAITLNLPGRQEKIEEYKRHLRNLGKAGIPYTTYAHMGNGIWSTEPERTPQGALGRAFDLSKAHAGHWNGREFRMPLSHGRPFSPQEVWDNFESFIRQVAPVAEEAGVMIGIHPDDPPVPQLAGVPRCIFSSFAGYRQALEMADSPNVGMCLCVGCWLEGGDLMGQDVLETIRYFGQRQQLFKVHFRNVTQPLPHFVETCLLDGYMDMRQVMRALQAVGFKGVAIPDHIPRLGDDPRVGTAYIIGQMQVLQRWAQQEARGDVPAMPPGADVRQPAGGEVQ
jgi:mannonate dehydratase